MNFIKPGEYDTFTVSSGYLPIILNAYLQGYNNIPQDSLRTIDDMYNNVLLNSVKINILGPGLDPLLIAQDHIDTLKSILLNGFRIGWITEQNVFNKYYNYLDSAGIYLANDQLHEYRNILNHILLESTNDSAETISSGIWLLLNYNIKHLILNTPIDKRLNFNIKLINSRGKSLTCGSLQYYEGGWNNAVNNGNGTFLVNTIQPLVSLHITYEVHKFF